ncbi:MAG: S-layer homology domain-containing protein [Syntrophomonadaceae bacterium]
MRKVLVLLLVFMLLGFTGVLSVQGEDTSGKAVVKDNQVTITGFSPAGEWVSLKVVREDGKLSYINQLRAGVNGNYQFVFFLDQGSYRAYVNVNGNSNELLLPYISSKLGNNNQNNGGSSGSAGSNQKKQSKAVFTIRGDTERGVILSNASYRWLGSCTVLDALKGVLDQNGISYITSGEYVKSIAGLAGKKEGYPLSGWLYKINGSFYGVGAGTAPIHDGDLVEWLYTLDGGKDIGAGKGIDDKLKKIKPEDKDEILEVLNQYDQFFTKLKESSLVINSKERMDQQEVKRLHQYLTQNQVDINAEAGREGIVLTDNEIYLEIPIDALNHNTTITIREHTLDNSDTTAGIKLYSSIYEFGPDGNKFNCPVTIAIKLAITDDINPEKITPAWYDEQEGIWQDIPAIIDLKNGLIIFRIDHFTQFALIEKAAEKLVNDTQTSKPQLSIADIDSGFDWAQEAICSLAGQGLIKNTGSSYELARNISRGEMLDILIKAKGVQKVIAESKFTDINEKDWFYDAITTASSKGWISGYPDSTFRPYSLLTRNEAAVLINRIFPAKIEKAYSPGKVFIDLIDIPEWSREAVDSLQRQGILNGYPNGSFEGDRNLSWAETAVIVYKLQSQ